MVLVVAENFDVFSASETLPNSGDWKTTVANYTSEAIHLPVVVQATKSPAVTDTKPETLLAFVGDLTQKLTAVEVDTKVADTVPVSV